jgi:hypothetical protein
LPLDDPRRAKSDLPRAPDGQLSETAERGEAVEMILVVQGHLRRTSDGRRWRMRTLSGRVVTFAAEWVVAMTPILSRAGPHTR